MYQESSHMQVCPLPLQAANHEPILLMISLVAFKHLACQARAMQIVYYNAIYRTLQYYTILILSNSLGTYPDPMPILRASLSSNPSPTLILSTTLFPEPSPTLSTSLKY